ncbi:hypothetical protein MRX96_004395 [Rhipicephalus microplus]
MKSTRAFARKATAAVVTVACILIVSLSTVSGQDVDICDPSAVTGCYVLYMTVLWREEFQPSPEGEYDEDQVKRGCSHIEEKFPCHRYLANCSEAVTGDLRIQERGYEALRNIMCDVNALKESHTAIRTPGKPPVPTPRCIKNPAETACFDQALNSSCTLSMTTAKAAMARVLNAAAMLKGCESSANALVVSRSFLVLLVVPLILNWLRT